MLEKLENKIIFKVMNIRGHETNVILIHLGPKYLNTGSYRLKCHSKPIFEQVLMNLKILM